MIIGHQKILDFFKKSIKNNRLAHAYLFFGPESVGKREAALELIRMLNGREIDSNIHPDVLVIEPEVLENSKVRKESEIGISRARIVQRQMSLSPYNSRYKVALVDSAEKMTSEAGNCLLKTLEEPSGSSVLILVASDFNSLLPTICSRCQLIKFSPVANEEMKKISGITKEIIQLANGRPGLAFKYLENPELVQEKKQAVEQLEKLIRSDLNSRYQFAEIMSKDIIRARRNLGAWMFWFRDLILAKAGCPELSVYQDAAGYSDKYSLAELKRVIEAIKRTGEILGNSSFNARLALEVLMMEL